MPQKAWSNKDERMYDAIKKGQKKDGKSEERAEEIAARTVNKQRRKEGRTRNKTSTGTGNPNRRLEDRTVTELRNRARQLHVEGRSGMKKGELIQAIRRKQ